MYDVVIAGGGPVGLGLAIDLGQRGISTAVVERAESPAPIPKGQNLTQRTMEHMMAWGVEDQIRAAKTIPPGVGLGGLTAYGSLLSGYHYDWFKRASVGDYYFAANERLPQYATETVLRARAAELESVDLMTGWRATSLSVTDDSVALEARRDGAAREIRGKYLVGCDGSRSMTRQAAGISETETDHERLMVLIVFESPEFFELISRFPDKQFYNVLHPDLDGYWMFFGMVEWGRSFFFHCPLPADTDRDAFDFRALIHRAVGQEFALDLGYVGFWDLRISVADSYRAGRVFIAGDAAHSHPPYGGYGINTGFEDARNLGWKLAADLQGWGGPGLLDSYDAERRPVFASTAEDFIERFIRDDRAFVRAHNPDRDRAGFEAAWAERATSGALQGISQFAPHYGGSPIVAGSAEATPSAVGRHSFAARPGHHLPPPPGGLDGFHIPPGPPFTVLSTDGSDGGFAAAAVALGLPLGAPIALGAAAKSYGAPFILVRPDGYVAWCGDAPEDPLAILAHVSGQ